jgi:hypothetical protein
LTKWDKAFLFRHFVKTTFELCRTFFERVGRESSYAKSFFVDPTTHPEHYPDLPGPTPAACCPLSATLPAARCPLPAAPLRCPLPAATLPTLPYLTLPYPTYSTLHPTY